MYDRPRSTRVYVGNLNDSIRKEDLENEFNKFGNVSSVWVALNPPGFAFVEFTVQQDAEMACDRLNGYEMFGVKLRVEISKPRRNNRGGGRFGENRREFVRRSPGGDYRDYRDSRYRDRGDRGDRDRYDRNSSQRYSGGERFRSRSPHQRRRY